jgi:hypothetical protein
MHHSIFGGISVPTYRQSLYAHFASIGAVSKDKDRKRFFTYYGGLYAYRKVNKQRSIEVEKHFAKEFQAYMSRYKRGMMNIFEPSIFFHPTNHAETEYTRAAKIRKPGKMLNSYQIIRYMNERRLGDEARLRHAPHIQ